MKIRTIFTLVASLLLLNGCSKQSEDYDYGMSVTIPSIVGTPISNLSAQELNFFRATNAFQTAALEKFYKQNPDQNIAISSLYLFSDLINNAAFEPYFDAFYSNFDLTNLPANSMEGVLDSIYCFIKDLDSSLVISSSFDVLPDSSIVVNQSVGIMFLYDDAVKVQKAVSGSKKDVFSLSDRFGIYESEHETVGEVPFGNGNYSLVMIKPKGDLTNYVENFSEHRYKSLIDSLREQNVNITFPDFDFTTEKLQFTFPKFDNMTSEIPDSLSVKVQTAVAFKRPNYAMLASKEQAADKHLPQTETLDRIAFDNDFIFLLRGRYSNIILLLGVYRK
ncbi:MAG: hypothetical protein LBO06_07330 [Bacteroidales bacterium]|jgi:hypothetical protein|nr:hypothetical protein [Bacteroidales bacterium]